MSFASQNRAAMNQAAGTQATDTGTRSSSVNPPGFVATADYNRMLASLSPSETEAYLLMTRLDQVAYEERWVREHPAGTTDHAAAYRLADSLIGQAAGTFNAILASNDRAQAAALAQRVADAQTALAERIRTSSELPGSLARRTFDIQAMQLQFAHDDAQAVAQGNVITTQTYVIGGVIAVALAAAAFAFAASQARKNPVVERSNRRVFIPLELLTSKELEAYQRSKRAKAA